jgi:hypothetical protein
MNKSITVVLVLVLAAPCSSGSQDGAYVPPMDPTRKVSRQVCTRIIHMDGGNLMCIELTEAQRRAELEEEARQARARREAEERAARERLERERAEQLAQEEAARKQRAAEQEAARKQRAAEEGRLAAERRRLEAEAARKAQEERERQERAEAEALAEQEAREAAERECRRLAQERLDGRALLVSFVDNYGKVEENKGIAGQITTFLSKARKVEPCPPANSTPQPSRTDNQVAKPR